MADSGVSNWDPHPLYELGNALIAFGDLLHEQLTAMDGARSDVTKSWSGDAQVAMASAFDNGLSPQVADMAEQFWNAGEAINYYAMLRNEQQITEAKQALASFLATLFGLVLGALLGVALGPIMLGLGQVLG